MSYLWAAQSELANSVNLSFQSFELPDSHHYRTDKSPDTFLSLAKVILTPFPISCPICFLMSSLDDFFSALT